MAGRGTDIVLGEGVKENGGLHILGTSRHESRRIDNQLRGRSGRQGDPGSSRFYMSLEDDLLRIFGGERITKIMEKLGMEEGEPIEHNLISKAIEGAQKKVEGHNFDIRKHLIEYDDVMNQQREIIYRQRREALSGEKLEYAIFDMIHEKLFDIIKNNINPKTDESYYNLNGLKKNIFNLFNLSFDDIDKKTINELSEDDLEKLFFDLIMVKYHANESLVGKDDMNNIISFLMLQKVDNLWKDHLLAMDHLKEGIGLRGYAQQNPLLIYKKEGFEMFQNLIDKIKEETLYFLFRINIVKSDEIERKEQEKNNQLVFSHGNESEQKKKPIKRESNKVGRNAPCPCGSGKKFKKCCG
jgi:preprotein translocase subunit SecA